MASGQTAVEYILLVGAVIMLVALVFIAVKQNVFNAAIPSIERIANQIAGVMANVAS